jgi:serine/threonine protein kinase
MEQFGDYRLLRLMGQGGFGSAFLAENIHFGTKAVIKTLRVETREEAERFLTEARIITRLDHPNIIRVLDSGSADGSTAFFVVTYAPNGTLQHHYRKGVAYPLSIILPHVKQIASALQHCHDRRIVHCDVKPAHFLLDDDSDILLCDFGLAVVLQDSSTFAKLESPQGTPYYMAPEQVLGEVSPASDQYTLGVVIYEWLCGKAPFEAQSAQEMMFQRLSIPPTPLRSHTATISPRVEQVVLHALSKDPQQRFPSIQKFADALEEASLTPKQIEVFFSYSHKDRMLRDKLAKQLAHLKQQGIIAEWHDRDIEAGRDWAREVDTHLRTAHIILLLISPDFLASDYCYNVEMMKALKRHESGEAVIIPVILRPTSWLETPLSKLQALPEDGKAITTWSHRDEAFLAVAYGIQKVIQELTVGLS